MQDFVNKKFNDWTVISYLGKLNTIRHWYEVKCKCGNLSKVERSILLRGKSTKCRSCARKSHTSGKNNPAFKHGYSSRSHPQFYMHYIWCSIKQRCNNPNVKNYHRYGGRGIKICPQWESNFEKFVSDMGIRPKGYSIDRIDNNKGYFKENCRWVAKEKNCNNTSKNIYYTYQNETLSETQWAKKLNISRNKFMYWVRKKDLNWVIQNIEIIKKIKKGMSDFEYNLLALPLPSKRNRKTHSGIAQW